MNFQKETSGRFPHELNVGAEDLNGSTRGYYEDKAHRIVIDIDCLQNDAARDAVNTIAHESFHAQEYRMVDVYEGVSEELKDLSFLRRASRYSTEFADYKSVDEESDMDEYVDYYYQELERDARLHAEEFSAWLFSWITHELGVEETEFLG